MAAMSGNGSKPGSPLSLPEPPGPLLGHSERVRQLIASEIQEHGPVGFDRFMELALYAPGLGYYSAGLHKLGETGDFITAPELSSLFARCLARQCAQVLSRVDRGVVLELGAGTGAMARDLLHELHVLDTKPAHYLILERSADLRARQHETLAAAGLLDQVTWLNEPPQQPFSGIIVGNEILDALPVKRFRKVGDTLGELCVELANGAFAWTIVEPDRDLRNALAELPLGEAGDPYESEINLLLSPWLAGIVERLERGVVLFIDYGYPRGEYYHPQRSMGTLVCHYRHRAHPDPFLYVGLQDITAFVDFTAVTEAGQDCGLQFAGFTNQAGFLMNCGLPDLLSGLDSLPDKQRLETAAQVKRLTFPQHMGEVFKVIALTRDWDEELLGFAGTDGAPALFNRCALL